MTDEIRADVERVWDEALVEVEYEQSIADLLAARKRWENAAYRRGVEDMKPWAEHSPGCNWYHKTRRECDCGLTRLLEHKPDCPLNAALQKYRMR